jgi:hypothetical protein
MFCKNLIFVLIGVLLILFISCNKNEDDPSDFRVVEVRNYVDGTQVYTIKYNYSGEKLFSSSGFNHAPYPDSSRSHFEYPDNNSIWLPGIYL